MTKTDNQLNMLNWQQPLIFDLSLERDNRKLVNLKESGRVTRIIDQIDLALGEIFDIKYPTKKDTKTSEEVDGFMKEYTENVKDRYGCWVFFPWSGYLVHFPNKEDLRSLRSSRNRNLVTEEEQKKLYGARILILGLSVGSNVVEALVSQGIGGVLGIVDLDVLEPTNLNRIRLSYHEVGQHKVDAIAKKVSEVDPFIEQIHFKEGITEDNYLEMMASMKPDIIIDEMDDLKMKILLREYALVNKVPVVMATDDGDNIILDIERFDRDTKDIFHNILPDEIIKKVKNNQIKNRNELGKIIGEYFVGFENVPPRMIESLQQVGVTLPSWPQLGGAAALSGIMAAYGSREIILNNNLESGRFLCGPGSMRSLSNNA